MKKNLLLLFLFVLLAFLLCEIVLRKAGVYAAPSETSEHGKYVSPFEIQSHGWFRVYNPYSNGSWKTEEFTHFVNANSEGLNDRDWSITKDSLTRRRIAIFGDSFTEGVGATNDSSLPEILQLNMDSTEVMNCGVAGSDPLFEYVLFKEKILKYHPDEIVICFIQTDIWDSWWQPTLFYHPSLLQG